MLTIVRGLMMIRAIRRFRRGVCLNWDYGCPDAMRRVMWVCCRSTTARVRGEGQRCHPHDGPHPGPQLQDGPHPQSIPNGGSSPSSETSKDRIPRRNYSATKDCSIRVLLPMPMPMNSSMGSRNCSGVTVVHIDIDGCGRLVGRVGQFVVGIIV